MNEAPSVPAIDSVFRDRRAVVLAGFDPSIYLGFNHRQLNAVMLSDLIKLGISSARSPRTAAAQLLSVELNRAARYQFALLLVVLSGLSSQLILGLGSADVGENDAGIWIRSPFGTAALEAGMLAVIVLATVLVGRAFGGTGNLDDAVLLITWLQLIALIVQVAFALVVFLGQGLNLVGVHASGFAVFLTLAVICYFFWMYACFVTVLHSFVSPVKVLFGVIAVILAIAVAVSSLLTALIVP